MSSRKKAHPEKSQRSDLCNRCPTYTALKAYKVDSFHIILGNRVKNMCQIYLHCINYTCKSLLFWQWLILIASKLLQQRPIDARFRSASWHSTLFSYFLKQYFKCNVSDTSVNRLVWGLEIANAQQVQKTYG